MSVHYTIFVCTHKHSLMCKHAHSFVKWVFYSYFQSLAVHVCPRRFSLTHTQHSACSRALVHARTSCHGRLLGYTALLLIHAHTMWQVTLFVLACTALTEMRCRDLHIETEAGQAVSGRWKRVVSSLKNTQRLQRHKLEPKPPGSA